jgi:hypothetical protein
MLVAHGSSCSYPKPVTRRDCSTYKKKKETKRKTREQEEQKEMRSNLKTMNLGIFTIYLANIVKMVNLCHLFTYPFPFSFLVILEKI